MEREPDRLRRVGRPASWRSPMSDHFSLERAYDDYPRIEEGFQATLDMSLNPRGPEMLYDIVRNLRLPPGAIAVDVGCGEGKQALQLAERFGFAVSGFDPVRRHIELANEARMSAIDRYPEVTGLVRFELGTAEALPVDDASVDLVWCRDVPARGRTRQGVRRVPESLAGGRSSGRLPELVRHRPSRAARGGVGVED